MTEFNTEIVVSTLRRVLKILEENKINYRFLGSVVVAGINGKLHRNLGDLDLLVDFQGKDVLYSGLKKLGYYPAKGMFTFARKYLCLETLDHPHLLEVGYFYGKWESDGSFVMGGRRINLTVEANALEKTNYTLEGITYVSIPERASAAGVMSSKNNPKRKRELLLLVEKGIKPYPNNYLHIQFYGLKADWLYHFAMTIFNLLGEIRVRFGMAFDPWR